MNHPNPAKHLFPAYFAYFHEVASVVHVEFITTHPGVGLKGPVSGIVEKLIPCAPAEDGVIQSKKLATLTLNTDYEAIGQFHQSPEGIGFAVRFSGQICHVFIPWEAVTSIYCRDVPGMAFSLMYREPTPISEVSVKLDKDDPNPAATIAAVGEAVQAEKPKRPNHLSVVKNN